MIDVDEPASGGDDRRFLHKVMSSRGPHRRDTPEFTDSTLFSAPSSAASPAAGGTTGTAGSSQKKKGKKKSKLASLGGILRRGRKKSLSEAQLRKRLRRAAERGDWDAARKLISEHEFSAVPEAMPKRGSFNADVIPEEPPQTCATRRPSYGSRGGDSGGLRRSFAGKESAAAAAVIKAALLEEGNSHSGSGDIHLGESSAEKQRPDIGENVLHDLCHFCPPLDVLELLLAGLRNRIGSTYGTDDVGRTPLHVAANSGGSPEAIDALVRADPSPASIGDADGRTPLHLAVRCLVHPPLLQGRNNAKHPPQETPSPEETIEQTLRIVRTLKEAMLTYPGRIDFKAEDKSGYSPLDYALDGHHLKHFTDDSTRHQELLQALIRRKEPRCRRSRPRGITMRSSRSVHSAASSVTEDQDIEVLLQLEREEVDARRRRLDKMKAKRKKERMSDALFDVFGIEQQPDDAGVPAQIGGGASTASPPPQDIGGGAIQSPGRGSGPQSPPGTTDEEQYHRHLEAYLDGYFDDDDFGGLDLDEDHGSFDIFEDPSEAKYRDREGVPEQERDLDVVQPPVFEIRVDEEDDQSLVSEVTVPLHA